MTDFELEVKSEPGSMPRAVYTAVSDEAKAYAAANDFREAPQVSVNRINRLLVEEHGFVVTMNGTPIKFE